MHGEDILLFHANLNIIESNAILNVFFEAPKFLIHINSNLPGFHTENVLPVSSGNSYPKEEKTEPKVWYRRIQKLLYLVCWPILQIIEIITIKPHLITTIYYYSF